MNKQYHHHHNIIITCNLLKQDITSWIFTLNWHDSFHFNQVSSIINWNQLQKQKAHISKWHNFHFILEYLVIIWGNSAPLYLPWKKSVLQNQWLGWTDLSFMKKCAPAEMLSNGQTSGLSWKCPGHVLGSGTRPKIPGTELDYRPYFMHFFIHMSEACPQSHSCVLTYTWNKKNLKIKQIFQILIHKIDLIPLCNLSFPSSSLELQNQY